MERFVFRLLGILRYVSCLEF